MKGSDLFPTRHEAVDLVAPALLLVLGVIGFRTAFGGSGYLLAGIGGVVVGLAVGYAVAKFQFSLLSAAGIAIAAFVLFGGPLALRGDEAGLLPTPDVLRGLLDGVIHGWARLVTTVAPAGTAGNLLVVPYFAGHVGAVLSVVAAHRWKRVPVCIVPSVIVVAFSILVGTDEPAALVLQGGVFTSVSVAWIVQRDRRSKERLGAGRSPRRFALASVVLLAVAISGFVIGPKLPLADAHERFVLRNETDPPFDPRAYPSPLVGYRGFLADGRKDDVLLRVDGLPEGSWLRWAVLDDYDGLVWAAGARTAGAGRYQHVGEEIGAPGEGPEVEVTVEVVNLDSTVWLPLPGSLAGIEFEGPRADALAESLRYNGEATAAAVPARLRPGDRYRATAVVPPLLTHEQLHEALRDVPVDPSVEVVSRIEIPGAIATVANREAAGSAGPWARTESLLSYFSNGFYSDGAIEGRSDPPGHYLLRLAQFVGTDEKPVGNAEQYAATMALMLRGEGVPSRVVMGFKTGPDGAVRAESADAWVEVAFEEFGWVRVDPTPPKTNTPDPEPPPEAVSEDEQPEAPPPTSIPPPPSIPEAETDDVEERRPEDEDEIGATIARILLLLATLAIPLAIVAGPPLAIVGYKRRRRRRRRSNGPPAARIAGGWQEVLDTERDTGTDLPKRASRSELVPCLSAPAAHELARRADVATFGANDPVPEEAEAYWRRVDEARAETTTGLGRAQRLRVQVSLASLRRQKTGGDLSRGAEVPIAERLQKVSS